MLRFTLDEGMRPFRRSAAAIVARHHRNAAILLTCHLDAARAVTCRRAGHPLMYRYEDGVLMSNISSWRGAALVVARYPWRLCMALNGCGGRRRCFASGDMTACRR